MSDITQERFADANRSKKHRVSRYWADTIYFDLTPTRRGGGVSIHSLVGPNVMAHYKEYSDLLSRDGKLHIYEIKKDIQEIIKRSHPVKNYSDRVIFHLGDFFELCPEALSHNIKYAYFDIDMCITYDKFKKSGGLVNIRNLSRSSSHLKRIWMCLTFCMRNSRAPIRQMRNEVIGAWKTGNLKLRQQPKTYRDGTTMVSMLFHCER